MTETETRQQLSMSDMSETDNSDADIDMDVRRMSMDAMKLLDSITDEVAELETNISKRSLSYQRSRSVSPASRDGSLHDLPHADQHEMSIDLTETSDERVPVTPSPPKKTYTNINNIVLDDDEDSDEDEYSDDKVESLEDDDDNDDGDDAEESVEGSDVDESDTE